MLARLVVAAAIVSSQVQADALRLPLRAVKVRLIIFQSTHHPIISKPDLLAHREIHLSC
jgi:hypothetical protein